MLFLINLLDKWEEKQKDKKFKLQLAKRIERERKKLEKKNGKNRDNFR
jgi:hypothetical protein